MTIMNVGRLRITARARLTALYAGLLLIAGSALVATVYLLMHQVLGDRLNSAFIEAAPGMQSPVSDQTTDAQEWEAALRGVTDAAGAAPAQQSISIASHATAVAEKATFEQLLIRSLVALAVFAVVSAFLAWWMSGRVLRPVHAMTSTARRLSGENLDERIALEAPPGELKDLADTFDGMLDRLQGLVEAQQRFVANAAHELRTPLAVQRAAVEIGLADPTPEKVARVRTKLLGVADRSEQLIEGLLLLSASDQGLDRSERVRADKVVDDAIADHLAAAERIEVTVVSHLEPILVDGDSTLLGHLVRNLLENALRYNVRGGRVDVRLGLDGLEVSNTGPEVPADIVPHLFEPFRRLHPRRHAPGEGAGLGLSIVDSIARAHGGRVSAHTNPTVGLSVWVTFGGPTAPAVAMSGADPASAGS
ncbi:ATP-binding protein [Rhodococcus sp. Q]|uniref:sensor histidine kinase n=1 Tax=Rhodococcus sp. Q TaxID=2502252 RepID=UPI001BB23AA2|nr:ATP-binding protein [Rhodococcus sp. Q]